MKRLLTFIIIVILFYILLAACSHPYQKTNEISILIGENGASSVTVNFIDSE